MITSHFNLERYGLEEMIFNFVKFEFNLTKDIMTTTTITTTTATMKL